MNTKNRLVYSGLIIGLFILCGVLSPVMAIAQTSRDGWNLKNTETAYKCEKCNRILTGYYCPRCKREAKKDSRIKYLFSEEEVSFKQCPNCNGKLVQTDLLDERGRCRFCGTKPKRIKACFRKIYACRLHPEQEFLRAKTCAVEITDKQGKIKKCRKSFAVKRIERSEVIPLFCCPDVMLSIPKCGFYYSDRATGSGMCPKCGQYLLMQTTCRAIFDRRPVRIIDQEKINEAIDAGVKYLIKIYEKHGFDKPLPPNTGSVGLFAQYSEMVPPTLAIYTLIKSGVSKNHPLTRKAVDFLLNSSIENMTYKSAGDTWTYVYSVSLAVMALEALDRDKYHERIAELAQFLVDSQDLQTGAWGYSLPVREAIIKRKNIPSPETIILVESESTREGTKIIRKTFLKRESTARNVNDYPNHSSLQFALLGLRSAERSGVIIPKETWQGARKYLYWLQTKNGSWGYFRPDEKGYGSMTFAGIAGLIICNYYLDKKDYLKDPCIGKAMDWIKHNFVVNGNPGTLQSYWYIPNGWYFYYLYCVERAGVMAERESFDGINWYSLIVARLLPLQQDDGQWDSVTVTKDKQQRAVAEKWWSHPIVDTCFALMCLQKITIRLIPTLEPVPPPITQPITTPVITPD